MRSTGRPIVRATCRRQVMGKNPQDIYVETPVTFLSKASLWSCCLTQGPLARSPTWGTPPSLSATVTRVTIQLETRVNFFPTKDTRLRVFLVGQSGSVSWVADLRTRPGYDQYMYETALAVPPTAELTEQANPADVAGGRKFTDEGLRAIIDHVRPSRDGRNSSELAVNMTRGLLYNRLDSNDGQGTLDHGHAQIGTAIAGELHAAGVVVAPTLSGEADPAHPRQPVHAQQDFEYDLPTAFKTRFNRIVRDHHGIDQIGPDELHTLIDYGDVTDATSAVRVARAASMADHLLLGDRGLFTRHARPFWAQVVNGPTTAEDKYISRMPDAPGVHVYQSLDKPVKAAPTREYVSIPMRRRFRFSSTLEPGGAPGPLNEYETSAAVTVPGGTCISLVVCVVGIPDRGRTQAEIDKFPDVPHHVQRDVQGNDQIKPWVAVTVRTFVHFAT